LPPSSYFQRIYQRIATQLPAVKMAAAAPQNARADEFVAWPFIDTLFDFTRIAGKGTTLTRGPIPQGLQKRVAVIGAGVGGLCAAFELLKCGVVPTVFEASNRLGGRAWSKRFTEPSAARDGTEFQVDAFAELGSMRVPPCHKTFWQYIEQLGLGSVHPDEDKPKKEQKVLLFPNPATVTTRLYYKNETRNLGRGLAPDEETQAILQSVSAWVQKLSNPFRAAYLAWQQSPTPENKAALVKVWQGIIDEYKDMNFYGAVVKDMPHWTTETLNAFGALGVGTGGHGPLYPIGMVDALRVLLMRWEEDHRFIVKGIEELPRAFYKTMVECPGIGLTSLEQQQALKFNHSVISISYDKILGQPVILLQDGKEHVFDAVIVATTTRSMSFMELTLSSTERTSVLSEEAATALRSLHMTSASKMFIRTKKKFWLDDSGKAKPDFPQVLLTDELPRAAYLLDYPNQDNGVVLISYAWEDDSERLQGLDVERRFKHLRNILYKAVPEWQDQLEPVNNQIYSIDWQEQPHYFGAYSLGYPGQGPLAHAAYFQFQTVLDKEKDRGVYLAGDGVSWAGGWTEGALQTALNAATAVAKRLDGALPEYHALMQDPGLYNYETGSKPEAEPLAGISSR
jgi:tryptophan 2-monooxygenase